MSKAVDGVITHDGTPGACDERFILHNEFNDLLPLKNVAMPITILTIWREVNDVDCLALQPIGKVQIKTTGET